LNLPLGLRDRFLGRRLLRNTGFGFGHFFQRWSFFRPSSFRYYGVLFRVYYKFPIALLTIFQGDPYELKLPWD
jgi:hypothetical protein